MWCAPDAVARITGWTREQVWLHIRWVRERAGRRFGDLPRSGTRDSEYHDALRRAGWEVIPVPLTRRLRTIRELRSIAAGGWVLASQRRHVFAFHGRRDRWRDETIAPVYAIHRVVRAKRERREGADGKNP